MAQYFADPDQFNEPALFSQGVQSGEFAFVSADARTEHGTFLVRSTAERQTSDCLLNLDFALQKVGLSTVDVVSLTVFIADYRAAEIVANGLHSRFGASGPAVNFVGVCGLEGGCRVRLDAIATMNDDREEFRVDGLPLSIGTSSHGVRVGDFFFLSGVDAADAKGRMGGAASIGEQTTTVLRRIESILASRQLGLGDLCRSFMFMPGTKYRPGYGQARKKAYDGIFSEDAYPPNSGIYIKSVGDNILLRSQTIGYRGRQQIVTSPKVRLAPGSFSQSSRVGDWLLLAGQDAVTFDRVVECEGSLAGQTEATLRHTQDIVEAAGGSLDDLVKTTIYLTEGTDRAEFAQAYEKFFAANGRTQPMPAGLTVVVEELSPRCFVEIDSVAYLGGK